MTLLHRPSNHLNKSLTILKDTFYENAQEQLLSSKFDNVLSTFFSDHLDQQGSTGGLIVDLGGLRKNDLRAYVGVS